MRRFLPVTLVAAAMVATGCATMTVSSHIEPDLDTARYETFDWGAADALPVSDPRLDEDPFFNDNVQGAIERRLTLKGLTLTESGVTPDLRIHYHANITERIDFATVDQDYEFCAGAGCEPSITVYEAGTLIIDIVDTRTNRVIWRGWAQDTIRDELENPDRMRSTIETAVARMLARFPGGPR